MRFLDVYIVRLYLCRSVQHRGQISGDAFRFYGRIKNAGLKQGEVMGCEKGLQRGETGFVMSIEKSNFKIIPKNLAV